MVAVGDAGGNEGGVCSVSASIDSASNGGMAAGIDGGSNGGRTDGKPEKTYY